MIGVKCQTIWGLILLNAMYMNVVSYIYIVNTGTETFFMDNIEKLHFWITIHLFLSKKLWSGFRTIALL